MWSAFSWVHEAVTPVELSARKLHSRVDLWRHVGGMSFTCEVSRGNTCSPLLAFCARSVATTQICTCSILLVLPCVAGGDAPLCVDNMDSSISNSLKRSLILPLLTYVPTTLCLLLRCSFFAHVVDHTASQNHERPSVRTTKT